MPHRRVSHSFSFAVAARCRGAGRRQRLASPCAAAGVVLPVLPSLSRGGHWSVMDCWGRGEDKWTDGPGKW